MTAATINVVDRIDEQIEKLSIHATCESTKPYAAKTLQEAVRVLKMTKARIEKQDADRIATPTVRDAYRQAVVQGLLARGEVFDAEDLVKVVDDYVDALMGSR